MAHQDQERYLLAVRGGEQLRQALDWLFPPKAFAQLQFRADCTWTPWQLVAATLLWAWADETTLGERFATARSIVQKHWPGQGELASSYQAWMKMLLRWSATLLPLVCRRLQGRMRSRFAQGRIAGWNVFGVDGSRFGLPRTASNQHGYCPASWRGRRRRRRHTSSRRGRRGQARQRKAATPQLWSTTLWHAGLGLPWDWRTGPADSSERAHWRAMLPGLPPGCLLTADAGFVGYEHWQAVCAGGQHFVIRVGRNVRLLKELGYARARRDLVYLWPDAVAAQQQPPLVLRLVVLHNGRHPIYLVSDLLDRHVLSDAAVAEIYRRRWGVEVYYRSFKQTFGRRQLRSHKASHAQLEFDWSTVGLWAACLYAQHAGQLPPQRLSVAGVLRAFRQVLHHSRPLTHGNVDLCRRLAEALLDPYRRRDKASRKYPCKKREKPPGSPRLLTATPQQIQLAHCIRLQQRQLGLTA